MTGLGFAIIIGVVLANIGFFVYFYRRNRHLHVCNQVLTVENYNQNTLLDNLTFAWCYWYEGDSFINCFSILSQASKRR